MEVVVNEEKKKIFRARKTMKISDRQQLETLHSTLLTSSSGLSNSPPPLMNGTHKEDGPNPEDNQQGQLEPVSPNDESPSSPTPELSLNLSPSPESAESPNAKDDLPGSPVSPFHSLNSELKKLENDESGPSSPNLNLDIPSEKRTSGIKRTLSEGFEPNGPSISREVKRPKMENEEFEAQLELKITAKAGNHLKLEKIVQKLVEDKLRVLEMSIFDRSLQELKDRVDQIDCRTKHHTAMNTLQAKIARLAKKFGEANQASENKKKQEALAAAAAASSNTTPAPPAPAAKTVPNTTTTPAISASVPTTTTLVSQTPILQLIASTANAVSNLTASSTTQSPTSTLVLKNGMMATGQPLLIQLPLSMANGQAGTLVNIPVSSLNAVTSLNKAKTTAPTTTFILKSAPTSTAVPSAATLPAIQAPVSHVPTSQISLARAVYQGGAGGITTPNSGVSVTSVRAPTQSVSVAGAMSSASSLVTSGPAATGSTAPGPPQGTSLTTKTAPPSAPRPKGSVIDLTEEDDDDSKSRNTTSTPTRSSSVALPPLPSAPVPPRLPPEAEKTSVPQQPQLKLVPSQTGIVLSWCVAETDLTCAAVDSYHLYAFHQDNSNSNPSQQHWKKIGEVKALPLPMACTLTQFQTGSTYHFAVRAKDIYGRFGAFCEPQCTNVINSSSS
uniref:Fibronectin type-III domain-containing protein n=1 Tax=Periophthalmus magnuspinnatus TaxID=409849 RepID=A0A3B3ZSI0_9GOBI